MAYEEHQDRCLSQFSSVECMQCDAGGGLDISFACTDGAEEVVQVHQTDLDKLPRGSYQLSCYALAMDGTQLRARCGRFDRTAQYAHLNDVHSGELLCNPPVGSFTLTCNSMDINVLSAECLKGGTNTCVQSSLNIYGYHGVVSNRDGELTRRRCSWSVGQLPVAGESADLRTDRTPGYKGSPAPRGSD